MELNRIKFEELKVGQTVKIFSAAGIRTVRITELETEIKNGSSGGGGKLIASSKSSDHQVGEDVWFYTSDVLEICKTGEALFMARLR